MNVWTIRAAAAAATALALLPVGCRTADQYLIAVDTSGLADVKGNQFFDALEIMVGDDSHSVRPIEATFSFGVLPAPDHQADIAFELVLDAPSWRSTPATASLEVLPRDTLGLVDIALHWGDSDHPLVARSRGDDEPSPGCSTHPRYPPGAMRRERTDIPDYLEVLATPFYLSRCTLDDVASALSEDGFADELATTSLTYTAAREACKRIDPQADLPTEGMLRRVEGCGDPAGLAGVTAWIRGDDGPPAEQPVRIDWAGGCSGPCAQRYWEKGSVKPGERSEDEPGPPELTLLCSSPEPLPPDCDQESDAQ